jgi:hypothetical protein
MRWLMFVLSAACTFSTPIVGSGNTQGPPPDGAQVDPCVQACAAAGGMCNSGTCEIPVTTTGDVTCPAGLPCHVLCNDNSACDDIVDCSHATSCTIDCAVANTCNAGHFDCRGPGCTIYCRAVNTCNATTIDIHDSSCDLECCAWNTCSHDIAAPEECSFGSTCPS